jgi:integrase
MEISTMRMILKWKKLWAAISDDVKMLDENTPTGKQLTGDEARRLLEVFISSPQTILYLTGDEERRLLEVCRTSPQTSLYTTVIIFSNTGLRNSELRTAKWSQVNLLGRPTFTVGKKAKTKGSAGQEVPLNQEALAAFQDWRARWPKAAADDYIFPSEKLVFKGAGAVERRQMRGYAVDWTKPLGSWKTAWRTAKKQAGVECRMHDLRHSFVSKLAETKTPASVIEDLAGHLTAAMRRRYTHISPQAKEQAVARISALLSQASQVLQ